MPFLPFCTLKWFVYLLHFYWATMEWIGQQWRQCILNYLAVMPAVFLILFKNMGFSSWLFFLLLCCSIWKVMMLFINGFTTVYAVFFIWYHWEDDLTVTVISYVITDSHVGNKGSWTITVKLLRDKLLIILMFPATATMSRVTDRETDRMSGGHKRHKILHACLL